MWFSRAHWLALAAGLAGACAFDPAGRVPAGEEGGDGAPGGADAGGPAAPDAVGPDAAAPACVDGDGDGFMAANMPGAVCDPADCDDADDRVYPGQTGAFTTPKASGGFDYDCNGVEEKLSDTTLGEGCHEDIFGPCLGTGWLGAVPACGQAGTWHRCEDTLFGCDEAEKVDAVMPCR
jgi:hypothetical protein